MAVPNTKTPLSLCGARRSASALDQFVSVEGRTRGDLRTFHHVDPMPGLHRNRQTLTAKARS